jgi:hypothetical protein
MNFNPCNNMTRETDSQAKTNMYTEVFLIYIFLLESQSGYYSTHSQSNNAKELNEWILLNRSC